MTQAVSATLAEFVATCRWEALPDSARAAAQRTLLNAVALGIGASRHPAVVTALGVLRDLGTPPESAVLGRSDRLGVTTAPLVNGTAMHVQDYDDTHLRTVVHPGPPIVPAVLAAAAHAEATGADAMAALVAGVEVALRVGNGVCPEHFDLGWHLTGTAGHIGAAAAASRAFGLDPDSTRVALALGATQAAGLTAANGSMTKGFHPGKAAADGVEAALLAQQGYTGPAEPIEGRRGFANVASPRADFTEMVTGLGQVWEIVGNAIKPYACGIVSHAAIDAAVALRGELGGEDVEKAEIRIPKVVLEVMGIEDPADGLQSKFSVAHCVTIGLLDGDGAPPQFSDERAQAPDVVNLRRRVIAVVDDSVAKGAAHLRLETARGRVLEREVRHATASAERPMTEERLERKVRGLVEPVLGEEGFQGVLARCARLPEAAGLADLLAAATGEGRSG
ncbi:MAG: MmgE/PrpD family protein [Nitriliruptorales bacterium]|nr:MmgE/PrpD family protein [Nitriliruptorales bacterium]